ncbi:MAG: UDP-N-acetylglucosamine 1-carboxyvinyltransferase [Oscillospiraceae bacterium]|nr:UDP-N-acetylglucosamine 1-carboxyvinyltransferase [Oscillospiraceae bacterium]
MSQAKKERVLVVNGGKALKGQVKVQGSKNSCLPILASTLLVRGSITLQNCPDLSDTSAACEILAYLGCKVTRQSGTITVDATNADRYDIPQDLMRKMRSSIFFLGPLISRFGKASMSLPGGCELGARPIDMHLKALKQLGVGIKEEHGYIQCNVQKMLVGTKINLIFPSVGATENIILASVLAKGETIINNAAQEPEIVDLVNFLNKCGAKIYGAGKSVISIEGVKSLNPTKHSIVCDRIASATYMCAGAMTGGDILLKDTVPYHMQSVIPLLEQAGVKIRIYDDTDIYLKAPDKLKALGMIKTMPYPGFPTDCQAIFMALSSICLGTTIFVENIFESRYKHACELARMGADIKIEGKVAVVSGTDKLYGANVEATDLRGGAALVLAGLCAYGTTQIERICHIERGYENIDKVLSSLGADIVTKVI